jgi:hypothetical protein
MGDGSSFGCLIYVEVWVQYCIAVKMLSLFDMVSSKHIFSFL